MEKMRVITQRESIEGKIHKLKQELNQIQSECSHKIIIMYKCSNYYWIDAKCLFCGKKIEDVYVLKKKEIRVINADVEHLKSNEIKYNVVKQKYEKISEKHPDWEEEQIVAKINKELTDKQ